MWWKVLAALGVLGAIAAISLPVATLTVKVDLPPAVSAAPACKSIELRIREAQDGMRIFVNGAPTARDKLLLEMAKAHDCNAASTPVTIRSDTQVKYGDFMVLTNELQAAGYAKVNLVTYGPAKQSK